MEPENRDQEDQQAFLHKSSDEVEDIYFSDKTAQRTTSAWKRYLRLGIEVAMALVIAGLLFHPSPINRKAGDKASPVPRFPRKTYTFAEDHKYLNEDMFNSTEETLLTLHSWIPLSSAGRGYVQIDDAAAFGLGEPYMIENSHKGKLEPVYMVSSFHQLHCLTYLATQFAAALDGMELNQGVAHHTAHCFDYLRQGIMCSADTTLEGKSDEGPGWGSKHECTDYDALLEWANEKTVVKWKTIMPGESTL